MESNHEDQIYSPFKSLYTMESKSCFSWANALLRGILIGYISPCTYNAHEVNTLWYLNNQTGFNKHLKDFWSNLFDTGWTRCIVYIKFTLQMGKWKIKAPITLYWIHHISDYFLYQIGLPFTLYRMNPICSISLFWSDYGVITFNIWSFLM